MPKLKNLFWLLISNLNNWRKLCWLHCNGKHHVFNFQIEFYFHDVPPGNKFILDSLIIWCDSFLNLILQSTISQLLNFLKVFLTVARWKMIKMSSKLNWECLILHLLTKTDKISPDLRWYEQKYRHSLPCFWSNHWELPIHRFHGGEFLEGFSIPKLKVNSRSKWSLEVKPYHFGSLFEVLPPSNFQVKSGIAFYNLSYACGIRVDVITPH